MPTNKRFKVVEDDTKLTTFHELSDLGDRRSSMLIGWQEVLGHTGFSLHYIMRRYYAGTFPKPIARVGIRDKKGGRHWSLCWDFLAVDQWAREQTV